MLLRIETELLLLLHHGIHHGLLPELLLVGHEAIGVRRHAGHKVPLGCRRYTSSEVVHHHLLLHHGVHHPCLEGLLGRVLLRVRLEWLERLLRRLESGRLLGEALLRWHRVRDCRLLSSVCV